MVLSKLNPFGSSDDDESDDPLDNIETTGGSRGTDTERPVEAEDGEMPSEGTEGERREKKEINGELADEEKDVPDVGRYHKDLIAPTGITPQVDMAKVGEDYTRTYFINGWPDEPQNGFLDEVLLQNEVQCDVSIHIRPFGSEEAIEQLKQDAHKAKAYVEESSGGLLTGQSKQEDFQETLSIYDALKKTNTELFEVGMYLTVRGDTEKDVIQASDNIVRSLRSSPALTKPEIAKYNQKKALQSVAPVMHDRIQYRTEMMGGAVAAMFPFGTKTIYEPGGIDFGRHAGNGSPVIVNRYEARDTGYNQLTIGDIGSGKSFSTKLNLLRTYAARDDVDMFIIDPLRGFESVNEILGGTPITVGGSLGINPLEISETPKELVERQPDIDPYSTQLKKVMDFFEMFFAKQGLDLGESRSVLQEAVEETYERAGITQDIDTHGNPSPTVQDVVNVIEEMVEEPQSFTGLDSQIHSQHIEKYASRLAMSLQQFKPGGQYDNLGGRSDIDFDDNDMFYIDLSQQEGSGTFGIIMHLLLGEVYEYSKQTDNKVMLAIDEAHYLMNDAKSLSYLTHVVRHSRHHNMSINFVTQTIEEFFEHEEAEKIAQNTSLKLFQKIESGIPDHIADVLDLTPQERYHIKNARPGNSERGFSEALIGVEDKGYYPLQVLPSELEIQLLNYEPKNEQDTDILEVANHVEGVEVPDRPNIEAVKEQLIRENLDEGELDGVEEDDEDSPEFGSEERMEQIKEEYGIDLSDEPDEPEDGPAQEPMESTPDEMDDDLEAEDVDPESIEEAQNEDDDVEIDETTEEAEDMMDEEDSDLNDLTSIDEDELEDTIEEGVADDEDSEEE